MAESSSHKSSRMMFWKKDKSAKETMSAVDLKADSDVFEGKDVGMFSLFVPFVKNYASSMRTTKNPAKLPYPTCYYLPQSSLMHMAHLQMGNIDQLINASLQSTPEERFIGVLRYCLSTCNLTKFPYKPIISLLGETAQYSSPYAGSSDPEDKTYILAENLRKDPPISCYHITNPKHGVSYGGYVELEPKFKQAHVRVPFKGQNKAVFAHPQGLFHEEYFSETPDLVIRLLRMHTELVGDVNIRSSTGYSAHVTFQEKSLFGKLKNQVVGKITFNGVDIYSLDGAWDEVVFMTNMRTHMRTELLNRGVMVKNELIPLPADQQPITSCDKIWGTMLAALVRQDFDTAAQLKAQINKDEGALLTDLERNGSVAYTPRYFQQGPNGWQIKDPSLCVGMGDVFNTSRLSSALPQY